MLGSIKEFAVLAVALAAAFFVFEWHSEHDAAVKLQAQIAAQQTVIQNAQEAQKQRDAQLAGSLARIQALAQSVKTPAQAAIAIPPAINSSVPQPITINMPPASAANPAPDATATIPQPDLKPIYDQIVECQACQKQVPVLQQDLKDSQVQIAALTKQRDDAVKASKGTFWSRVKSAAKWVAIGAAAGAVGLCASGHCK